MRLLFLASGAFAVPTLRWLARSEHEIAAVVSQPPRPSGRGRRVTRTPVQVVSEELGLPVFPVEDVNAAEVLDRLRALDARLGLVIAFGQKLGAPLLASTPGGFINLHASLLPKYRGAAPINWAIVNGEESTGCTLFRINERMDAGSILVARSTNIRPEETAGELHDRLADIGVDAVRAALQLFVDGELPEGTPQDDVLATRAPKLTKSDGFVRFDCPAEQVVNRIHGMTPWPGASARFETRDGRWEKLHLVRVRRMDGSRRPDVLPGTVNENLCVATSDGFVEVLEIQPSSGRIMTWQEFVNGRHVAEGDMFSTPRTQDS